MSGKYCITTEEGITRVRFRREPDLEQARCVIDELAEKNAYERRLLDFTGVNPRLRMDELRDISNYEKTRFTKPNRLAIIAPEDLVYGEMRAFMVYREESHARTMVFRTEAEAMVWLQREAL